MRDETYLLSTDEYYKILPPGDRPIFDQAVGGFVIASHRELGVFPRSYKHATQALALIKGVKLSDVEQLSEVPVSLRKIPSDMGYRSLAKDGPVGMALQWLQAALTCNSFVWDADQRYCAEKALKDAREWMQMIGPVPDSSPRAENQDAACSTA